MWGCFIVCLQNSPMLERHVDTQTNARKSFVKGSRIFLPRGLLTIVADAIFSVRISAWYRVLCLQVQVIQTRTSPFRHTQIIAPHFVGGVGLLCTFLGALIIIRTLAFSYTRLVHTHTHTKIPVDLRPTATLTHSARPSILNDQSAE